MKLLILPTKSPLNVLCHSQGNVMCRKTARKGESWKPHDHPEETAVRQSQTPDSVTPPGLSV